MSSRTYISGAYRHARDGVLLPIVETFHFAAADSLLGGGHGWTLTSMQETPTETIHVSARGDWEHPQHRGSWTRIVVTEADVSVVGSTCSTQKRVHLRKIADTTEMTSTAQQIATRQVVIGDVILSLPVHATLGTSIARAARDTALVTFDFPTNEQKGDVHNYVATALGVDQLDTPDGPIRGYAYQYVGGRYTDADVLLVGGDGLLAAYRVGDTTVWRAGSSGERSESVGPEPFTRAASAPS
jgi:hypothetical protein